MKVLVSAFACGPHQGSEPEVGLRVLEAAASEHDVWLVTRSEHVPDLERFALEAGFADRVAFVGLPAVPEHHHEAMSHPRWHAHYDRWQRAAGRAARTLDRRIDFDVVHHATVAAYWARAGVAAVDKPFLLGPVGGAAESPLGLWSALGASGLVEDGARVVTRRWLARALLGTRHLRRADLLIAQNDETAARLARYGRVWVAPNALAVSLDPIIDPPVRQPTILFAGNLIPLKGAVLAVRALAFLRHPTAKLRILGDGPERQRIETLAQDLGVLSRLEMPGRVSRAEMPAELASASVFIHPALHDEAPLSVAEALSMRTPVVTLDRGGPRAVARCWPESPSWVVTPSWPRATAQRIAVACDHFLAEPQGRARLTGPRTPFKELLLKAYAEVAAA